MLRVTSNNKYAPETEKYIMRVKEEITAITKTLPLKAIRLA